jgi:hypothetical protein
MTSLDLAEVGVPDSEDVIDPAGHEGDFYAVRRRTLVVVLPARGALVGTAQADFCFSTDYGHSCSVQQQ